MNTHKNARLTYLRRLEMVQDLTEGGLSAAEAGCKHGVSAVTARKWLGRETATAPALGPEPPKQVEKEPVARPEPAELPNPQDAEASSDRG